MNRRRYQCPKCGEKKTLPIVYGMPSVALFEEAEAGKVKLGGCILRPDMPDRHCRSCGTQFRSETGFIVESMDDIS